MKECDNVKTYSDPSYIFSGGGQDPNTRIYTPAIYRAGFFSVQFYTKTAVVN